jgi:excisionase family DNA binding protein
VTNRKPIQTEFVISVEEAGRRLGLGRNQAYNAAHCGQIPVVRLGRRLIVPLVQFEKLLAGEEAA